MAGALAVWAGAGGGAVDWEPVSKEADRADRTMLGDWIWRERSLGTADPLAHRARRALVGGWAFLLDKRRLAVDTIWTLRQLPRSRHPEVAARLALHAADHAESRKSALLESRPNRPVPEELGIGMLRFGRGTLAAFGENEAKALRLLRQFVTGFNMTYLTTHQLLASILWETVGRRLPPDLFRASVILTERVWYEQRQATAFSDLYAERAAFLGLYADPCVEDLATWAEVILDAQESDGIWHQEGKSREHPTMLSMMVLHQYIQATRQPWRKCPYDEVREGTMPRVVRAGAGP